MIKDTIEPSGKDYRTAKRKALARDGFRYVVIGQYDATLVSNNVELERNREHPEMSPVPIEACHILNDSTTQNIRDSENAVVNKTKYAARVMATMMWFGLEDLANSVMEVGGVHQVCNLLSLYHTCHWFFDDLELWFEATGEPNCCKVCSHNGKHEMNIRRLSLRPEMPTPGLPMMIKFSEHMDAPPLIPNYLLFMRHVFGLRTCLELPNSPTS